MASRSFFIFLLVLLFALSLSIILFELALTRIFSIVLWYDYAFMAISIAFFGLGIGSFMIHIQKDQFNTLKKKSTIDLQLTFSSRIVRYAIAYGIFLPIFIFLIGYIPSDTSYIYLFYLISSVPFFFAGAAMALIFLAMSEKISKLYFADLIGAALATIILDPMMQSLGAGSFLLLISAVVVGFSACSYFFMLRRTATDHRVEEEKEKEEEEPSYHNPRPSSDIDRKKLVVKRENRVKVLAAITFSGLMILLIVNSATSMNIFEIKPGMSKGLYYQLNHPSEFQHLSEEWNSFSRVDVTRKIGKQEGDNNNILNNTLSVVSSKQNDNSNNNSSDGSNNRRVTVAGMDNATPHELASIIIDADAATPIYRWDGSQSDIAGVQKYMDYLPYEMINANNTLVIGSGGGQDIIVALSSGVDNVTAVELNPLVVSAVERFESESGNIYSNNNVELIIDDGRRFISSSSEKYDVIVLKLVDSWAAQLAGGYALSENYLYTVEAFQQYFRHLDKDNGGGMLVMTRWNFELPRLMPLIVDSLVKETGKSRESVAKHVMVIEDRPGLYFGRSDDNQKYYPILLMIKSTPFLDGEVTTVKEKAEGNRAEITMLADNYVAAPFNKLFNNDSNVYREYFSTTMASNPTIPTDDSPFYFAREQIPKQMIILLVTVVAISGLLSALLIYHARKTRVRFDSRSSFHVLFAIFIGVGFMILEVTFIQKFLLLLGTPIMALTVILFTILLSSGIGSYISGRIFSTRPHRAVLTSIPILAGIIVIYFLYLQDIIEYTISMELQYRIALTFGLLFPAGFLMGFQFPSLIKMASLIALQNNKNKVVVQYDNYRGVSKNNNNTTLLWGTNIVASVVGTVIAAILAMIIGFNGNLLIGLCMYLGAGMCALFSIYYMMKNNRTTVSIDGNL
jgi:predicted membrane-bound spermidine synthase